MQRYFIFRQNTRNNAFDLKKKKKKKKKHFCTKRLCNLGAKLVGKERKKTHDI